MANKGSERQLPATHSGPKPGDYPLGSVESRAATSAGWASFMIYARLQKAHNVADVDCAPA